MFVSDFMAPVRLIEALEDAVGHTVTDIDGACVELLEDDEARVSSLGDVDDDHFIMLSGDVLSDVSGDEYAKVRLPHGSIVMTYDTTLVDLSRHLGEMTSVDIACAFSMMSKSQVNDLVLLRYNEIAMWNNPFMAGVSDAFSVYDSVLRECRSVVIDLATKEIVSLPYYKFRNLNECDGYTMGQVEARIAEADTIEFSEKLDGSMIQMRWLGEYGEREFGNPLLVSSSGSLTSEHMQNARDWVTSHPGERYVDMCRDDPDRTYVFEYVNPPVDHHIVQYDRSRWDLYLTGIRDVRTGRLAFHDEVEETARRYGIRSSRLFEHYDLGKALNVCHSDVPSNQEGFVLNVDGFLVKIKLDSFLDVSKLVHSANSFKTIIRNVSYGLLDDLIATVPSEYRDGIMGTARELQAYDVGMREMVDKCVTHTRECSTRAEAASYINGNVPKFAQAFVFNDAFGERKTRTFLGKYLDTESPCFLSRNEFDENVRRLCQWKQD